MASWTDDLTCFCGHEYGDHNAGAECECDVCPCVAYEPDHEADGVAATKGLRPHYDNQGYEIHGV